MFTVTRYPHGTFSWADCMTSDAAAGKQFYADLMGWDTFDIPMGPEPDAMNYTMFLSQGQNVAAISGMMPGMEGVPPAWSCYVTVDDVDAMAPRVEELGGKVVAGPFDVFDSGRMLTLQGPDEAHVSLWQPKEHIGAGLVNTPGAPCWNELYTKDPGVSTAFYGALLGWTFMPDPNTPAYQMILNEGRMNGGMLTMDEDMAAWMPPVWMPYFSVADINAAAERVPELGGTVQIGPLPAGEVGHFLLFADPQGAHCYLIQLAQPEPWLEHEA